MATKLRHDNLAVRLHRAGFSPEELAQQTGGSVRSAYRWIFEGREPLPIFQRRLRELVDNLAASAEPEERASA